MVDPNLGLQAASGLVSFLLKTIVESLVCLAVVRLTTSARWRFNVWLAMLLTFCAQWAWMWLQILRTVPAGTAAGFHSIAASPAGPARRIAVGHPVAGSLNVIMIGMAGVYAAVLLTRMFRLATARLRLARVMRHARIPGERVAQAFTSVLGEAQAAGVELGECELRVLPGIASPATVGWRYPVVIVPPICELHSSDELAAIFWHELKHVQRRDALWNALAQCCSAILWFHPAAMQAAAQLRVQRELACDADVVREHPHARDLYAACLVQFARTSGAAGSAAAIEMASRPALLTRRVQSVLDEKPTARRWSGAARFAANAALVAWTLAALPHVNVLFADNAGALVLHTSPLLIQRPAEPRPVVHAARTAAHQRLRPALQPAATPAASTATATVAHDDVLAAQHRAALDVLTESTGMEPATGTELHAGSTTGPDSHRGAHAQSTSWARVAVDAAERIGPMMGDHDHDGHMH